MSLTTSALLKMGYEVGSDGVARKISHENRTEPKIQDTKPQEQTRTLEGDCERKTPGAGCPLVRYTLRRVRLLDVDAKWGSVKDTLDGLQHAGLIPGDREDQIRLEVSQERVKSFKEEETIIEIEYP